jgi:hypothetical protein
MADPLAWIHTLMRGEGGPVLAAGSILFAVGALAGAALAMRSDRSLLSANS